MRKLENRFIRMKEIDDLLTISEEEKNAIRAYKGSGIYDILNELVGAYIPLQRQLNANHLKRNKDQKKYYFGESTQAIEEKIREMVKIAQNLYSAMYKSGTYRYSNKGPHSSKSLGRGSTHSLLRGDNGFISSSTFLTPEEAERQNTSVYQESINWATSNNRGLSGQTFSRINLKADVPCIYVENFVEGNGSEREVLISPFVDIKRDDYSGRFYNGEAFVGGKYIRQEFVEISGRPLSKMSKEDQQKAEEELFSDIERLEKSTVRYYEILNEIEKIELKIESGRKFYLDSQKQYLEQIKGYRTIISDPTISEEKFEEFDEKLEKATSRKQEEMIFYKEQTKEREEKLDLFYKESGELKEYILSWKTKFRQLIEAKCADVEMDIDSQIDAIVNPILQKEEAEKKAEEERIIRAKEEAKIRLENGAKDGLDYSDKFETIIESINNNENYKKLLEKQERMTLAGFGKKSPIVQLKMIVDSIGSKFPIDYLSETGKNELESPYNNGTTLMDRIRDFETKINQSAPSLANMVNNDCKRTILENVLKVRAVQEGRKLYNKRNEILNAKIGLFGKKHKEEERRIALDQIDQKLSRIRAFIDNIQKYGLDQKAEYDEEKNHCGARSIVGELRIALTMGADNNEKSLLESLETNVKKVFGISEEGIDKKYQEGMARYSSEDGVMAFLNKYEQFVNRGMQQPPNHPLLSEARIIQKELDDILTMSAREYDSVLRKNNKHPMPFKPMERD
ncbi:MAG: hypothetical protein IKR04_06805 [Clostridia bacterium]|nr:hypothetical protein [Clostridia bacterium]